MASYRMIVATKISSHALSEFEASCERCGRQLRGKGSRGNALGHVLCKDCGSDKTWQRLASGSMGFDDLQHDEVA